MSRKFAKLIYLENMGDIPVKYNVIKKDRESMMDWYVKKFNPFKMEGINIFSQPGYLIRLPITRQEALKDREKAQLILTKTIQTLKDYNVDIVLPPHNMLDLMPGGIKTAGIRHLFPFFAIKAAVRILRLVGRNIRGCEFVIINGNNDLTESLIDAVYTEINYLTVVNTISSPDFLEKADDVFYETGLDIRFSKNGKNIVKTADIIINTAESGERFDYSFKRGAVYFDLSGNLKRLCELINNRPDMLIIDGLKISSNSEPALPLNEFELAFYLKNSEYRYLINKKYDINAAASVYEGIQGMKLSVTGFYQLGEPLCVGRK